MPPIQKPSAPQLERERGLLVGNETGLTLWAPDGSAHRSLSRGPALHPLRVGDDAVLALVARNGNLQQGAQLVRISVRDGARTRVADLPAFACAQAGEEDDASDLGLDVQDGDDFELDASGDFACLTLMDRNANMVGLQLELRIELANGRVRRWLTLGEDACQAPPDVRAGEPPEAEWCQSPAAHQPPPPDDFPFDYDDDSGLVQRRGGGPVHRLLDYMREEVSPSGRWLVLGGDIQDGDYIHRSLLLCDRSDGALYPVLEAPGPWPAPLTAAKPGAPTEAPKQGMADVVGESDVRWIGSASDEQLIVDELVIRPGRASWRFEGELAR